MEWFAKWAAISLQSLNFVSKRDIVVSIVNRVVANQRELSVTGNLPITEINHVEYKTISSDGSNANLSTTHVGYKTISRHGSNTVPLFVLDSRGSRVKSIPFSFTIQLPKPRYARMIVGRNKEGKILRSIAL
jgi:hypothetical protein